MKISQNKYNAAPKERRTVDGIIFASRAEMKRYLELKLLERAGEISRLELQPRFLLVPATEHGGRAVHYVADFSYMHDGIKIIEDVKGVKTAVYKVKKKMLLWKYPDIHFYENKV